MPRVCRSTSAVHDGARAHPRPPATPMPFDLHAFISYAHIDNEPLEPGQPGWVSRFHAVLKTRLSQRLGEPARLWRDDKLRGDDVFGDEIRAQLPRAALLVSILSPRYVRSDWCTAEVDGFAAAAGATQVQNKTRVVKVLKTPLAPGDKVPPVFERTLGHPFYRDEGERQVEIDPAFGDDARQEFLRRVSDLAVEMADNLRALADADSTLPAPGAGGQVVFVAECGRDLQAVRAQLMTDLRLHGHTVLPAQQLPLREDLLRPELDALLARATLAVHLVGSSAGPVPEGPTGQSLVALQNAVAADQSRARGLRRLLWLAPGAQGERPEHQAWLDALQTDAGLQRGADLLRGDAEALKGAVHQVLQALQRPATPPAPAGGGPRVHLLMTEADRAAAVPLIKALRALGLAVSVPVFVGDAADIRQRHAQLVAESRAVVVVYGAGDEAWKFHQLSDLQKQAAMAGAGPLRWLALLPPLTPDKALEQALADPATLDLLAGVDPAALAPLQAALQAAAPGARG
jgi:hypothetical protein